MTLISGSISYGHQTKDKMVARGIVDAKLKTKGFNTSIKVKLSIEDEEYEFLNREDIVINADITIKYKAHKPIEGNNLFLVYCKKEKEYKLCSGFNVEDKINIMEEGRGHKLGVEVCCPYSVELEAELSNKYKLTNWTKLSDEDAANLVFEMTTKRNRETFKNETLEEEKETLEEVVEKEEIIDNKAKQEKEEITVGPSVKEDPLYPPDVLFLGGEFIKLDTKFWLEKLPELKYGFYNAFILVTIEEGKKTCYGEYINFYSSTKIINNVEDIVMDLLPCSDNSMNYIQKEYTDILKLLLNDSNVLKRIKNMYFVVEENKKYLGNLKKVYEDYYMEIYEKSSDEDISFIYSDYIKSHATDNWCYHYNIKDNIKDNRNIFRMVKASESTEYSFGRQCYVPSIVSRLPRIVSESETVRKKFKEFTKTNIRRGLNREVDFDKVSSRLFKLDYRDNLI